MGAQFTEEECKNLLRSNHAWMLHMLEVHCGDEYDQEDARLENLRDDVEVGSLEED